MDADEEFDAGYNIDCGDFSYSVDTDPVYFISSLLYFILTCVEVTTSAYRTKTFTGKG